MKGKLLTFVLENDLSRGNCRESFEEWGPYTIDGVAVGSFACTTSSDTEWNWIWTNDDTYIMGVLIDIFWRPLSIPSVVGSEWRHHGVTGRPATTPRGTSHLRGTRPMAELGGRPSCGSAESERRLSGVRG
jgi:hypothetical protein